MFKKGLDAELKKLLPPCIYPDFNTLTNMAIITERAMAEEKLRAHKLYAKFSKCNFCLRK
jgi:hypothetical protein